MKQKDTLPPASPEEKPARHLEEILRSPEFHSSRRLTSLLRFLFEESIAGRGAEVSQYRIASDCFGITDGFDADDSSLVRSHVRRLRQALERFYQSGRDQGEIRFSLPLPGYQLVIAGKTDRSGNPLRAAWPKIGLVEFKGIGFDKSWHHFPALLTEELSVILGNAGGLGVVGPFSRALIEQTGCDVVELGRRHALDFILDGSVQWTPDRLIVWCRLLDGESGLQIWSERGEFRPDSPGVAGFENWLSQRVLAEVGGDFGRINKHVSSLAKVKPEDSLKVYEAILIGRAYLADFDLLSLPTALGTLRSAVVRYPREPEIHSTLAVLLTSMAFEPGAPEEPQPAEIELHARRAWELDGCAPWSLLAQAGSAVANRRPGELEGIGARVLADDAAPVILLAGVGVLLCYQKCAVDIGLALIERSIRTNPHYPRFVHLGRALVRMAEGELEAALEEMDAYSVRWGWADPLVRGSIAARRNQHLEAAREGARLHEAFPDFIRQGERRLSFLWHQDHVRILTRTIQPFLAPSADD